MSRLSRSLFAMALLALAPFARAGSLHLLAPVAGATLRGGSFAEVRWSAAQLPPGTEEWEAFLSLDGGKYYAFRITPHLDVNLHRFTFVVPNVDTHDARVLIRTGNERRETLWESPATFSIARDAEAEQILPRLLHRGRGEAARAGDPPVLWWAAGERSGAGVAVQSAAAVPTPSFRGSAAAAVAGPDVLIPAGKWTATVSTVAITQSSARRTQASETERLPRSVDLLLVCRRRNI